MANSGAQSGADALSGPTGEATNVSTAGGTGGAGGGGGVALPVAAAGGPAVNLGLGRHR